MVKVITYGTYDMLHYGHIRLMERAKELGDYLIVGITSSDYDKYRGKINVEQPLIDRIKAVKDTGLADEIIVEEYEGPHDYEARIISNIESSILSDDFFKKRFSFVNRQTLGQRVDIPRYLNGDQRCWFAVKRKKKPNRAVRVFAPIGGQCTVSSEEMAVCGALSCAIVEMLEANGINAELWASCCVQGVFENMSTNPHPRDPTWDNLCQLVKLKDSCDYCDYGMVNYVCGNSQFYRNIVFKDRISHGISLMQSGLRFDSIGGSYNFSREYIPEDEDHDADLDIVVPRLYNIEIAREYIHNEFCGNNSKIGKILNAGEETEQCA